jgi:hypothetical protein
MRSKKVIRRAASAYNDRRGNGMEQGKNMIKVEYRHGLIKDFEKRVLAEGRCGAFLPMSFVAAGGKEMAYCDCSGYRPLGDIEFKNSREIYAEG